MARVTSQESLFKGVPLGLPLYLCYEMGNKAISEYGQTDSEDCGVLA
jgi:hypothetical protein